MIGVHGKALQYSVGGGNLGFSMAPCHPAGNEAWSCQRYDSEFSSTVPYRVKVDGLGCWRGERVVPAPEGDAEKHLSDCITIWDEIRLMNALF